MTGVKKVFTLLIVEVVLLGAAFGGGLYLEMQKRKSVEKQLEETKKKAAAAETAGIKTLAGSRGRTQVLEAALGVIYQNYGMAFDRVVRTKSLASHMGIGDAVNNEIDELMMLLTQQKPEAVAKLLSLADKMEATPSLTLPKGLPAGAVAPTAPGAAPAPGVAVKPGAPAPALPALGPAPVKGASGDAVADHDFAEGREALRHAKELLLSGGESQEIVKKLARAQVLLDDSGYTNVDDELGAAIKAQKSHDEARVRTSLEAALARLRAR